MKSLESGFTDEVHAAKHTVEYWRERAEIERGEVVTLEARVKELENELAREREDESSMEIRYEDEKRRADKAEADRDAARTHALVEHAENDRLRAAFDPVREWYDGDGERTDIAAMLHDAIKDLQRDREELLRLRSRIAELEAQRVPNPGVVGTLQDKNRLVEYKDQLIARLQARIKELEAERDDLQNALTPLLDIEQTAASESQRAEKAERERDEAADDTAK